MPANVIRGNELIEAIAPLIGVKPDAVSRVIIDASWDRAVHVYVEEFGTRQLLQLDWAGHLKESQVTVVDKPQASAAEERE